MENLLSHFLKLHLLWIFFSRNVRCVPNWDCKLRSGEFHSHYEPHPAAFASSFPLTIMATLFIQEARANQLLHQHRYGLHLEPHCPPSTGFVHFYYPSQARIHESGGNRLLDYHLKQSQIYLSFLHRPTMRPALSAELHPVQKYEYGNVAAFQHDGLISG